MSEASRPSNRGSRWKRYLMWRLPVLLLLLFIIAPSGGSHVTSDMRKSSQAARQAHAISVLMMQYAENHHGVYPTGNSSTEVFQKLVDEFHMMPSGKSDGQLLEDLIENKDANDPAIFWLDLPGKTRAISS